MKRLSFVTPRMRRGMAMSVLFCGTAAVVKSLQDLRYSKKDMKSITEGELNETDLEIYQKKFKLSNVEMAQILEAAKQRNKAVNNEYESNPNFQHKRVEARDDL